MKTKSTSTKRLDRENPFFLVSEGTKFALNAPGIDWKRDLSMIRVRICEKKKTINVYQETTNGECLEDHTSHQTRKQIA